MSFEWQLRRIRYRLLGWGEILFGALLCNAILFIQIAIVIAIFSNKTAEDILLGIVVGIGVALVAAVIVSVVTTPPLTFAHSARVKPAPIVVTPLAAVFLYPLVPYEFYGDLRFWSLMSVFIVSGGALGAIAGLLSAVTYDDLTSLITPRFESHKEDPNFSKLCTAILWDVLGLADSYITVAGALWGLLIGFILGMPLAVIHRFTHRLPILVPLGTVEVVTAISMVYLFGLIIGTIVTWRLSRPRAWELLSAVEILKLSDSNLTKVASATELTLSNEVLRDQDIGSLADFEQLETLALKARFLSPLALEELDHVNSSKPLQQLQFVEVDVRLLERSSVIYFFEFPRLKTIYVSSRGYDSVSQKTVNKAAEFIESLLFYATQKDDRLTVRSIQYSSHFGDLGAILNKPRLSQYKPLLTFHGNAFLIKH